MKYLLKNLSIWELGKRSNQEDSIYPEHDKLKDTDKFFIVCDGMGGHSAGEVASATVCQSLAKSIKDNVESDSCFGKEQFDMFMSRLKETNTTLGFYCDFEKINNNVESISIKLNQLNYLIGQVDMDAAIRRLWDENRNVFSILEILIAAD